MASGGLPGNAMRKRDGSIGKETAMENKHKKAPSFQLNLTFLDRTKRSYLLIVRKLQYGKSRATMIKGDRGQKTRQQGEQALENNEKCPPAVPAVQPMMPKLNFDVIVAGSGSNLRGMASELSGPTPTRQDGNVFAKRPIGHNNCMTDADSITDWLN
ncbi:hypothetical protein B0O80DRAFT_421882 [Mortierella sp. GBAus27b]|nr:hypothetical protein B0O80DRAFT_421882 [Mortierella sp. GBAus27b]